MLVAGIVVVIAFLGVIFVLSPQANQREAQFEPIASVQPVGRELHHGT